MGNSEPGGARLGHSEHTDVHPCPHCGAKNDAATGMDGATTPGPGDVSVCAYCYRPAVFARALGRLTVRPMTEAEEQTWRSDPKWAQTALLLDDLAAKRRG